MGHTEDILKQILEDTSPNGETMELVRARRDKVLKAAKALLWRITHISVRVGRPSNCEWRGQMPTAVLYWTGARIQSWDLTEPVRVPDDIVSRHAEISQGRA